MRAYTISTGAKTVPSPQLKDTAKRAINSYLLALKEQNATEQIGRIKAQFFTRAESHSLMLSSCFHLNPSLL